MSDGDKPSLTPELYVLAVAIASAAFIVALYHCVVILWCNRQRRRAMGMGGDGEATNGTVENSTADLIPIHKYKKDVDLEKDDDRMCPVCLSEFEEGEELRTLPECAHTFHVPCIDMWLYSHRSCPMCRAIATPSPMRRKPGMDSPGLSVTSTTDPSPFGSPQ